MNSSVLLFFTFLILGFSQLPPKVLVNKQLMGALCLENEEFGIAYTIKNLDEKIPLLNFELHDTFAPEEFDILAGAPSMTWTVIPPNTVVKHSIILKPKTNKRFSLPAAEAMFKIASSDKTFTTQSNQPLPVDIFQRKDLSGKIYFPYAIEWLSFFLIATPCVAIPYFGWLSSTKKFN